jgi:cholesterol transport system auxiliary component
MRRRVVIVAPLALAACGSVLPRQQYIPQVDWPLAPPPPQNLPANPGGKVVLVRDLAAAPGLDERGLRLLRPDGSMEISYYSRWAVEPEDAATAALSDWLEASGMFAAVVGLGSRLTASLIVEGELSEFLADESAGQARAVLTLVVIANAGGIAAKALPLAQARLTGTAPLRGTDAPAEVAAMRAALADALGQAVGLVERFG